MGERTTLFLCRRTPHAEPQVSADVLENRQQMALRAFTALDRFDAMLESPKRSPS
jgi:D-alanine-D-alanine ligase-like ATP-grasp enzyme